jgi:hypothetical protein
MNKIKELLDNEWVILIGVLLGLTVGMILLGYLTDTFEGFASIVLLALAIALLWKYGQDVIKNKGPMIGFILVFTFLGLIFDRAGNFIYNKPIEMLCPSQTILKRKIVAEEDYEGNTQNHHYFSCYPMERGQAVVELPLYQTVGIRFIEYIVIGFVLLGVYWVISRLLNLKK